VAPKRRTQKEQFYLLPGKTEGGSYSEKEKATKEMHPPSRHGAIPEAGWRVKKRAGEHNSSVVDSGKPGCLRKTGRESEKIRQEKFLRLHD